jgi:hypothetical protein
MDCDEVGSIIPTFAIITHGSIIEANLSPEKQDILKNVRLFSLAGDVQESHHSIDDENTFLQNLNDIFQMDLDVPTSDIIEQYANNIRPAYQDKIQSMNMVENVDERSESKFSDYTPERRRRSMTNMNSKNVCRIFDNITIDKILGRGAPASGLFYKMMECIMPPIIGVFLISIHKKISDNHFELLYPSAGDPPSNLNLFNIKDFTTFANMSPFNKPFPAKLFDLSTPIPSRIVDPTKIEMVEQNKSITNEEKNVMLQQQRDELAQITLLWDVTISADRNYINAIRMSTLVKAIKDIIGTNSKINLLDYSCTNQTLRMPRSHEPYLQKFSTEQSSPTTASKKWGGKYTNKSKNRRHVKSKKNKKSKNKNKNKRRTKRNSKKLYMHDRNYPI